MADGTLVRISTPELTATISSFGAELLSLTDAQGRELMSNGNPAFWSGRAPLLFPIVGRLNKDVYKLGDTRYSMRQHGFARHSEFSVVRAHTSQACFRLSDSAESRANYPFSFTLDMDFALEAATLSMTATITNTGDVTLPASFGFHPAFAWPLPFGQARTDHRIVFAANEPGPLCSITKDGLIGPSGRASPVNGDRLALEDSLFSQDALVWKQLESRSLHYGTDNGPGLEIDFPNMDWLGIWTKPGADFICIEPWSGMADPEGYDGDFRDKPGIMNISPGANRLFQMNVTLTQ